MFKLSSLKIYLIVMTASVVITILAIDFMVLPKITKTLIEIIPKRANVIKNRVHTLTMVFLIFVFLLDFYFWRIDNNLTEEEKKFTIALQMNPKDPSIQQKLQSIETKRKNYITLIEIIFTIILSLVIGYLAISVVQPFYQILGTI